MNQKQIKPPYPNEEQDCIEQIQSHRRALMLIQSEVSNPEFLKRSVKDDIKALLVLYDRLIKKLVDIDRGGAAREAEHFDAIRDLKSRIEDIRHYHKIAELLKLAQQLKGDV